MTSLQPDTSYHIFNHANGFENVFREVENYRYFLEKYQLYIFPIAETYAWCLMPNHFHLVVSIRKRNVIEELISNSTSKTFSKVPNFGKGEISSHDIEKFLSKQFANLFSCYTQSFNKMYNRKGSLFIKNFKREPITDKRHFIKAVVYTHRNPIHHGFRERFDEWEFSSYFDITEEMNGLVEPRKLFKIFGSKENFIQQHQQSLDNFDLPNQFEIP
jgi:putative transposase